MTGIAGAGERSGRLRLKAAVALAACVAGVLAGVGSIGAIWEGWVSDRLLQVRAVLGLDDPPERPPVAVIGLDSRSLTSDELAAIPRVFMTPAFAAAGEAMFEAGALGVGYDFVFAFSADAFVDPQTGEARLRGYDRRFLKFLYDHRGEAFVASTTTGVPHRTISAASGALGVRSAEIAPDSDGVVRRHTVRPPLSASPSLIDALAERGGSTVERPYIALPASRLSASTPYLSLVDVLACAKTEEGRAALRDFARDRIVLFGSTMPDEDEHLYADRFLPPGPAAAASPCGDYRPPVRYATSGVFILADLIGAPVSGRYATEANPALVYGLVGGFAVAGAFAGLGLPLMALPFAAVGLIAAGLAPVLFGLALGVIVPPAAAASSGAVALVVAGVGKVGVLQRRERALVRLFGHYLSPQVIKRMADQERLSDLGGETRRVVVAFIDIVGFTRMSEKLADRQVVSVVNTCFDAIGAAITASEGYIDKYIGDAIMAVWNAPNDVAEPDRRAVECARTILSLLPDLRRRTGIEAIDLRIALNSGPALVGDIGGSHRRSFTVMGTTVNTASRIEAIAKEAEVRIAFSQSVADALPPELAVRRIWQGRLRGLSVETVVFTLQDSIALFADRTPSVAMTSESEQEAHDATVPMQLSGRQASLP